MKNPDPTNHEGSPSRVEMLSYLHALIKNLYEDRKSGFLDKIESERKTLSTIEGEIDKLTVDMVTKENRAFLFKDHYDAFLNNFDSKFWETMSEHCWFVAPLGLYETAPSGMNNADEMERFFGHSWSGYSFENQISLLKIDLTQGRNWLRRKKYRKTINLRLISIFASFNALRSNYSSTYDALLTEIQDRKVHLEVLVKKYESSNSEANQRIISSYESLIQGHSLPSIPWNSDGWTDPIGDFLENTLMYVGASTVLLGTTGRGSDAIGAGIKIPRFVSSRSSLVGFHDNQEQSRARVHEIVQNLLLRVLASGPLSSNILTILDPIGMGRSVDRLLDIQGFSDEILGPKVWSSERDIENQLLRLTNLIEERIQKNLRSEFSDVFEYNLQTDRPLPIQYLVIFDFGAGMSRTSHDYLQKIINSGRQAGILTYIVGEMDTAATDGLSLNQISLYSDFVVSPDSSPIERSGGSICQFSFEPVEQSDVEKMMMLLQSFRRILATRITRSLEFGDAFAVFTNELRLGYRDELRGLEKRFDLDDCLTWWTGNSAVSVAAPIGNKRKDETTILRFDSKDHFGALLVGRPGSGKSTLLHTFIMGLSALYAPEELSLYLIDFKQGVEFKIYAELGLPHARCIAIETEREFGLSVLETINSEIERRSQAFKKHGGSVTNLEEYRNLTGEMMPRIVLLFDEFQELFKIADQTGLRASRELERIIRQGRFVGVHVILSSQSLSGADALDGYVTQLLPIRILMQSTASDATKVLGDGNDAGLFLREQGECILNEANSAPPAFNQHTNLAILSNSLKRKMLQDFQALAEKRGSIVNCRIFEGNSPIPFEINNPNKFVEEISRSRVLRLRQTSPMSVERALDITLSAESGNNVLAVARGKNAESGEIYESNIPQALVIGAVVSALVNGSEVLVFDFSSLANEISEHLSNLEDFPGGTFFRGKSARSRFEALLDELLERIDDRNDLVVQHKPTLLVVIGLHRTDLGVNDYLPNPLTEKFVRLLENGPDSNIFTWLWTDSLSGFMKRLPSSALKEFNYRIVGQCNVEDSELLLGDPAGTRLRENQICVRNVERETITRCISFSSPEMSWIEAVKLTLNEKL